MTTYEQMREALKLCGSQMCRFCKEKELARSMLKKEMLGVYCHPDKCEASRALRAALAAPARNCDIYATVEEARKVWCGKPSRDWDYLCDWLYASATEKEGGAK